MDTQAPKGKSGGPPGGQLQSAITTGGNLAWMVYSKTHLSSAMHHIVPAATRDAAFQLFCDLKANTPKDQKFLMRHAKAFKPETTAGWLALTATLGYSMSALLLLSTLTIGISVAGLSIGLIAAMFMGIFLASSLGFLAFLLFASAFAAGALAFTALSGYVVMSSSIAVMKHVTGIVFGVQNPSRSTQKAPSSIAATSDKQQQEEDVSNASQVLLPAPPLVPEMVVENLVVGGDVAAEVSNPAQAVGLRPIKTPRKASPCPSPAAGSPEQASSSSDARLATPTPCSDKEAHQCDSMSCAADSANATADSSSDVDPNSPLEVLSGSPVEGGAVKNNHKQKKSSKGNGAGKRREASL